MKNLFSSTKKSSKAHSSHDDENTSNASSPTKSPTKSSSKSPSKRSSRAASPGRKEKDRDAKPRSSRSFTRQSTEPAFSSPSRRTAKLDLNTHPLNLPPEERKRYSTLSNMADPTPMDIDEPTPASSPPPSSPPAQPQPGPQTSFSVPITNGMKDSAGIKDSTGTNGADTAADDPPPPPPHRSPTSPGPGPAERAEGCKAEGNKAFKDKNYSEAIKHYSQAIELVPNSATYLSNRAAAYMSNHQYEAALKDCSRAGDLDPQNPKVLTRLARIYVFLGQPEDALVTFDRIHPAPSAKDTAPAKEMAQHVQAAQNALRGETKGSMVLHALNQAERGLGPGAAKPQKWQLMRGEAYLKIGDANALGEAQNTVMALLRQNSQDPEALVLRGRILYAQGENDKAVQHFRKALSCDPDFKDAVKYLRIVQKLDRMKEEGNKEYKAARWEAAIKLYTDALAIDPTNRGTNSKILQNRALCRTKLKQFDEAIADCERAVSLDPSYVKARKTKAKAFGLASKWEDCVREWKSIQELEPEDRTIAKEIRTAELELKKSQRKDYYKILEVEKDADDNTIKKAYRKLAIVHHPDKNAGDPQAEERFKEISEAYDTLSDPQKRAHYDNGDDLVDMSDMFGGGHGGMGGMGGGGMGIDPELLFNMMSGGGGFPGGAGHGGFGNHTRGGPSGFHSFTADANHGRQRGAGGFQGGNFNFN